MGASHRLGDDPVDDSERLQILSRHPHRLGGVGGLFGRAPQDRGAAFGRDDGVDAVLEHQDPVGGGDGDGAARAPFPDDGGDHRHAEREAGLGRAGDRFRLAALLGLDSREGAGRVDQADDGQAEAVGELHQADGLAIAFRLGHAEIVGEPAGRVVAFLMADQHDLAAAQPAEPADDRRVLAESAVARERDEVLQQGGDIVLEVGPVGMSGDLGLLPWGQPSIGLAKHPFGLGFEPADLGIDVEVGAFRRLAQLLDAVVELGDRFFEV
jgi:hypothetical protein